MSLHDALSFWKSSNKIRAGTLKQVRSSIRAIGFMILMCYIYLRESSRMKSVLSESRASFEFLELRSTFTGFKFYT